MISFLVPLILSGAALAQAQPQATEKIAADMNVEVVSLLGQKLYRAPASDNQTMEKLQAALEEADKQVAAQPDNPNVHMARGQALSGLWRYHDAIAAYTKVLALAPKSAEAYARRGNMFVLLRLFDQAKNDWDQAIANAPQDASARTGLGITNYLRQKFEDADKAFSDAEKIEMNADQKRVEGFWHRITLRRLGKEVPKVDESPPFSMGPYVAGLDKLLAGDKPGALAAWRKMTEATADWPVIGHIAAEAEIAAVEGTKKMKAVTF